VAPVQWGDDASLATPAGGAHQERSLPGPARAIGYASVATDSEEGRDAVLKHQAAEIESGCRRFGLDLLEVVNDLERGSGRARLRPGLEYALDRLAAGEASALVVCDLGRLRRSVTHLGAVISRVLTSPARLIVLDLNLDTGTPEGRLAALALTDAGNVERELISEHTRSGLAAARRKGGQSGRPSFADRPDLRESIVQMRAEGMTLQAIADRLNAQGIPTLRGGKQWRPSSVHAAARGVRPPRAVRSGDVEEQPSG
jgi:DNA invertase Pin-like site-specific DNA recombinase